MGYVLARSFVIVRLSGVRVSDRVQASQKSNDGGKQTRRGSLLGEVEHPLPLESRQQSKQLCLLSQVTVCAKRESLSLCIGTIL